MKETGAKCLSAFLLIFLLFSSSRATTVIGVVTDQQSSQPVPNVVVKIIQTGDSTQTDATGHYMFANVAHGSYTFMVGRPLYQPKIMVNTKVGPSCCVGTTGNVNQAGGIDLSDLSAMVSYLTGGSFVPPCPASADVNKSGVVDLSDLSALVSYLTGGSFKLPTCP